MSNLRDKAREVKAAGEAERGNFEPLGAPLRVYKYWARNTQPRNVPKRENFCHFWRVVAIWAPLMFLRKLFVNFVTSPVGMVTVVVSAVLAIIFGVVTSVDFRTIIFSLLLVVGIGFSILSGIILATNNLSKDFSRPELAAFIAGVVVMLPVGLIAFGVTKLFVNWNSDWDEVVGNVLTVLFFLMVSVIAVTLLIVIVVTSGWFGLVKFAAFILATTASVVLLPFVGYKVSNLIAGRRALARRKDEKFLDDYFIEHGELYVPSSTPRQPGKIAKFFTGVGDFIIFIAQIVRVKKWKMCPIVTISDN